MESIESNRKELYKRQTKLRQVLMRRDQFNVGIKMFLEQHALLHSVKMIQAVNHPDQGWSFEDAILNDLPEELLRRIPSNGAHSIAWCIWHIARIEDVAMNLLVAESPQIIHQDDWLERINVKSWDTGNEMNFDDVKLLSQGIEIGALRNYRIEVGRKTREIVKLLKPEELFEKVEPDRIQRVKDEGAIIEAAYGITEYWSRRNIAGLLLMPATRHNLVHLNEALQLKQRLS